MKLDYGSSHPILFREINAIESEDIARFLFDRNAEKTIQRFKDDQ